MSRLSLQDMSPRELDAIEHGHPCVPAPFPIPVADELRDAAIGPQPKWMDRLDTFWTPLVSCIAAVTIVIGVAAGWWS